jgi:hypothetical protein
MKKKILLMILLVLFFLIPLQVFAATTVVDNITKDSVWTKAGRILIF